MFAKFSRSWALIKASAGVLKQDKELLVFPLVSSIAAIAVAASFIVPMVAGGGFEGVEREGAPSIGVIVWSFAFYLSQYFVMFFFNTALVGAAMIRLEGGDPTVRDGFRIAFSKLGPLLGYAAIAATVGMILRGIEERAPFIGKVVAGMLGLAWTFATFLTVPVLVSRDIGPIDALKESATLLKKTWGENLIGNGGIGIVFGLMYVLLGVVAVVAIAMSVGSKSAIVIGTTAGSFVVMFALLALIQSALQGIYSAALYRYASEGQAPGTFDGALLGNAFSVKNG